MSDGFSRFYTCDLHVHSPADFASKYGDVGDRESFAEELVAANADAGVEVIAVTDHNTTDWYPVLAAAGDRAGVAVFPGVEVNVQQCHVIGIWERDDEGLSLANQFLDRLWDPGAQRFQPNGQPVPVQHGQVGEVAGWIAEHHGLAIAPHTTGANGLFKKGVCNTSGEVARSGAISAFDPWGNNRADVIGNSASEFGADAIPSWVLTGDVRSLDDVGRRTSYLKLGDQPTLEGLRQAFLAPETRIRIPSAHAERFEALRPVRFSDKPQPSWPRITNITVRGGFHSDLGVDLAPGLNALIGGKGTGKSTLIEIIRHVVGGPGPKSRELEKSLQGNLQKNFKASAEADVSFLAKDGEPYVARRSGGGGASKSALYHDEELVEGVAVERRLSVRVFGQRELQELGGDKDALRRFLASHVEEDWDQAERDEVELDRALRSQDEALDELERDLAGLGDLRDELSDVKEVVDRALAGGAEELVARSKLLNTVAAEVETALRWPSAVLKSGQELERLATHPPIRDLDGFPPAVHENLDQLAAAVSRTSREVVESASTSIEGLQGPHAQWLQHLESERSAIAAELSAAGIDAPDELATQQQRVAQLTQDLLTLPEREAASRDKQAERLKTLELRRELRRRKSRLLEDAGRALSSELGARVRIVVEPLGDLDPVHRMLTELGFRAQQRDRLIAVGLEQVIAAVRAGGETLSELAVPAGAKGRLGELTAAEVRKIDQAAPDDSIVVEVNLSPDAGADLWTPVADCSPGQRAMALIELVLATGADPIVIDQPEDDLDNRYIYEEVVRLLAEVCTRRQVIVATHNANIPVLGDAEFLVALEAGADRGTIVARGGLEQPDVAEQARGILEGGDAAFQARHRRYLASKGSGSR